MLILNENLALIALKTILQYFVYHPPAALSASILFYIPSSTTYPRDIVIFHIFSQYSLELQDVQQFGQSTGVGVGNATFPRA